MSSFSDLVGGVKRSGNFVWDTNTLAWVKMTQPGGGTGGGGAATIADGADVTQGALADTAWGGSGSGSVVAILKKIAGGVPVTLTSTTITGSVAVTGSFYQATQPVSLAAMPSTPVTGTFWQATQPVSIASMPSTPVTGTFWQATQPVSGNLGSDLRIGGAAVTTTNPVPIMPPLAGSLPVSQNGNWTVQPITFASPQAVTGTFYQATQPVSIAATVGTSEVAPTTIAHAKATVTTAGTRVQLAAGTCKAISIKALAANTGTIYVGGATVAAANGYQLAAGDTISLDISNTSTMWIDSSVNGEGVTWMANN